MTSIRTTRKESAYSLAEVLIASAILLIGISAAASLSLTMTTQEETSHRIARALNIQENYARLYQLGLAPSDIQALMIEDSAVGNVTWTDASEGDLDGIEFTMTIDPVQDTGAWTEGSWTGGSQATVPHRQFVLRVFRPFTR